MDNYLENQLHTSSVKGRIALIMMSLYVVLFADISIAATVDRVLATVNNEIVTLADYKQFAKISGEMHTISAETIDTMILRQLIEEKIVVHEALKRGLDVSDEEIEEDIEYFIDMNGLTRDELQLMLRGDGINFYDYQKTVRDKILFSKLVDIDVNSKIIIRDHELQEFYNFYREKFLCGSEKVELKAVFLAQREDASVTEITDLKRRALHIAGLLKDGNSFERIVNEHSDEPVRSQEGVLGTFERGTLIPALNDVAFSLKENEISDPIWVPEGIYILKLVERIEKQYRPFEDVKDEIYQQLFDQKRVRMFNEWVKTLWEQASVTINQS
jgi:parvulin-like peptidyl-prolyl isomerase